MPRPHVQARKSAYNLTIRPLLVQKLGDLGLDGPKILPKIVKIRATESRWHES